MKITQIVEDSYIKTKVIVALVVAEMVVDELKSDADGYLLAKEALELCWNWVEMENIEGDKLAIYVDSPTDKDLGVREELYGDNEVIISALVVLCLAIGLTARFAYQKEGKKRMSTPIWETNANFLFHLIDFASKTTLYKREKIEQFIARRNKKNFAYTKKDNI